VSHDNIYFFLRCLAAGILVLLLILAFSTFSFDGYPTFHRNSRRLELIPRRFAEYESPSSSHFVSYESILQDSFSFNINGSDVIVFLHIQKTGEEISLELLYCDQGARSFFKPILFCIVPQAGERT